MRTFRRLAVLALTAVALWIFPGPKTMAQDKVDRDDIEFITEHLPESVMDARFLSLPWEAGPLEAGHWQQTFTAGYVDTASSFLKQSGPLLAGSALYAVSDRWGWEVLGFYDAMAVSGGGDRKVLRARFHPAVPIVVPAETDFSAPRGDYRHFGVGFAVVRTLTRPEARRPWSLVGGVLWSHLSLEDYQVDYQVASGPSAGIRGVLDHSSSNDFFTPFVGLQQVRPLGRRFSLTPHAIVGVPLPAGDFDGRITGPGFDLSSDPKQGGRPGQIGDGFVGLGLDFEHVPSGLSIDLGASLVYLGGESLTHEGVDHAFLLTVAWHHR